MEQQIRFCTTSDGVRIAYAVTGTGYPLVWVPGWLSHAEIDWDLPILGERYHELTKDFMLLRLDKRGTGLSTRGLPEYTREGWVRDVEAVVEHAHLERFALAGYSEGGPIAVEYAALHPEKVSHLILMGAAVASGEDDLASNELLTAMVTIIKTNWGSAVKVMSDMFLGEDASVETQQASAAYQRQSADPQDAAAMLSAAPSTFDIAHLALQVQVPTLVMHARQDHAVPIEYGQRLAAMIPGAAFKSVEGQHVPDRKQSAEMNAAIREFVLGVEATSAEKPPVSPGGLVTILFTDMESSSALRQQLGDAKAQELVRTHNTIVRQALKSHAGAEIKHTGDGIMASFPSAIGALECAVAIQRGVAAYLAAHPEAPLGVYVGLNAGEPIAEEQDLFGTSVDLARRLCDQAAPGEILVSNVVRELASGKGFLFSDRGAAPLKGFDDPVRLYEVRWREE
jgi:class 3 adenylate cyclase